MSKSFTLFSPAAASRSLQATIKRNEYINSRLPSDVFDLCIMRTVSAAARPFLSSRHLAPADCLLPRRCTFGIPKRVFFCFFFPAVTLLLFCLEIFLAWRSSDSKRKGGFCRLLLAAAKEKEQRKWGKRRESEAARSEGRSTEERGQEWRRKETKATKETKKCRRKCVYRKVTPVKGREDVLERQITSFTKQEQHKHSQTWRSVKNEFWLLAVTAGDTNIWGTSNINKKVQNKMSLQFLNYKMLWIENDSCENTCLLLQKKAQKNQLCTDDVLSDWKQQINQMSCSAATLSRQASDLLDWPSSQLILILLTETVSHREELPRTLLVHFPNIGFLAITKQKQMMKLSSTS